MTKYIFGLLIAFAPAVSGAVPATISLPRLIETFMIPAGTFPDWSMGATSSTPQIHWQTVGVQAASDGSNASYREGSARVTLHGKELQNLRQRLEPIQWDILMSSDAPAKFGPQQVAITPKCDTVACQFNFERAMAGSGIVITKLCQLRSLGLEQSVYRLTRGHSEAEVVVDTNFGSGGTSNDLTIFLPNSPRASLLCVQAGGP